MRWTRFLTACSAAILTAAAIAPPVAAFPERPVTIIVPFGAGGGTDLTTRVLGPSMAKALGTEIVVTNVGGAGGTIGTAQVARSKADGYTIGMMPVGPMTTQPHLRNLPYSPASFDYICLAYSAPTAFVVKKDSPFNTVKDLVDYAKANPGKLNYGTPAPGSLPHIANIKFTEMAGIKIEHLPFKGSAATLKGTLDGSIVGFIAHISMLTNYAEQIKAIGVLMSERVKERPNIPTFKEQGYDLHTPIWGGLVAPKGIPAEARDKLEAACKAGIFSDAYMERMTKLRQPVAYMGGAEFKDFVDKEYVANGKALKAVGLKK